MKNDKGKNKKIKFNPVAKYCNMINRACAHKNKKAYTRKIKHKNKANLDD